MEAGSTAIDRRADVEPGELATDLIESAIELDVHGVDFLIDTLDQLVERVNIGTLLAHLTLDLGLGHSGIIAANELVSAGMRSTERSPYGAISGVTGSTGFVAARVSGLYGRTGAQV